MICEILLNIIFGLMVGFIGGYAGIAGAPILIFLMTTFLGYHQHLAQGTVIAIMLGPMTLPGLFALRKYIKPLIGYAVIGVCSYACFSYIGAVIAYSFSNNHMRLLFSIFLFILGLYILVYNIRTHKLNNNKGSKIKLNYLSMGIFCSLIGVIGGLFGIGAGIIIMPVFTILFKLNKDKARTLSLLILLPPVSLGAVIRYSISKHVLWPIVIFTMPKQQAMPEQAAGLSCSHSRPSFWKTADSIHVVLTIKAGQSPRRTRIL